MLDDVVDVRKAAAMLGISKSAVHKLIARGTLPAVNLGFQRWIRKTAIRALMADPAYQKRSRRSTERYTQEELEVQGQRTIQELLDEGRIVVASDLDRSADEEES